MKTFKYRLKPNTMQTAALEQQLRECARLYNAAIEERKAAWQKRRKSISEYDQTAQLKDIRADGTMGIQGFKPAQEVLKRVDLAFQAFFRRLKAGQTPGYPRFKSWRRYESFSYLNCPEVPRIKDGRLLLQGMGSIKIVYHRPVEGHVKKITIKREAGYWFACFVAESPAHPLPPSVEQTGVDVGLEAFATLSDGTRIDNPRYFQHAEAELRRCQRRVARRRKGSHRRRKAIVLLQRAHLHVRQQRRGFQHRAARDLVNRYGLIAVEDLNIKGMASGMLAKGVHDVGWGTFLKMLEDKAEEAGRQVVKVDARGTSQTCPCGAAVPKALGDRWHLCDACGLSIPRDHVTAKMILQRAKVILQRAGARI